MSKELAAVKLAVLSCLGAWFETYSMIRLKTAELVKPSSNELQRQVSEVIEWCDDNSKPIRLIILKPRQKGCSTVSVAALYHRCLRKRTNCAIIGGAHKQSKNLMDKILRTYAEADKFDGGGHCKVGQAAPIIAKWKNGSECEQMTARDGQAGRSGTYQSIVATEVALWAEEGVADAKKVLAGLLKCVSFVAKTMIILESTAGGASGDYYERYQKAVTFEEAKAGKAGYIRIFMPWFVFEDSKLKGKAMNGEEIYSEDDFTKDERELADKWGLDCEQVAWMRWALREECDDDMNTFKQDYPFDERSAFLTSGRGRFNADGLDYQLVEAEKQVPQTVVFEANEDGHIARRIVSEQEAMWDLWEQPVEGRRYLIAVDNMTGESQVGGDDPDSHGIKVLRAGYMCRQRGWVEPAVVCEAKGHKDRKRFGVWWDTDILADEVYNLSVYYGGCIIVPEMNMDKGLVELLKLQSANIYQRKMFNRRDNVTTKAYGWMTDKKTRGKIIENLSKAIREAGRGDHMAGLQVRSKWTIKELRYFVIKPNGRAEAAQGYHDDQVLALAIGLQCIEEATTYYTQRVAEFIPRDVLMHERRMRKSSGGRSQLR
tara:strand:+ start:2142 stop:3941 length:1800 start_codon:yes stop_codon:yes gene_type:complete